MRKKKRKGKEIIGEPIKEYPLSLLERIAHNRPYLIWFFWSVVTAMIVAPTIVKNYENWWYYLLIAPVMFFFIKGCINSVRQIHYSIRCFVKIYEYCRNSSSFRIFSGPPGTGKSFCGMFLSYMKALYNWQKLKFKYWCICKKLKDKDYNPTVDELEVIEAYKFYIENGGVPCWGSNTPAYSKKFKRYSYDITSRIVRQEERAPYMLSGFYDEWGTEVSLELKDARKSNACGAANISDFCKFPRHFGELEFVGGEQDPNNLYKDARRVVGEIRVYNGKKELLKPRFLMWLYEKFEKRFTNRMRYSDAKLFSGFMVLLNKYINACGYMKFTYKVMGNTETGANVSLSETGEKEFVYIPCANDIVYRTRAFREAYLCKNDKVRLKPWTSLYMTEERARSMLKSENLVKKED